MALTGNDIEKIQAFLENLPTREEFFEKINEILAEIRVIREQNARYPSIYKKYQK